MEMVKPDAVIGVNLMIERWAGKLDYSVTLHPEALEAWQVTRRRRGFPEATVSIAHVMQSGPRIDRVVDYRWPGMNASGSSGLFAAKVALEDGFDRIILAGVPISADGGHFTYDGPWIHVESYRGAWKEALPHLAGRVRSMSGWTAEILGKPTKEWLAGEPQPNTTG